MVVLRSLAAHMATSMNEVHDRIKASMKVHGWATWLHLESELLRRAVELHSILLLSHVCNQAVAPESRCCHRTMPSNLDVTNAIKSARAHTASSQTCALDVAPMSSSGTVFGVTRLSYDARSVEKHQRAARSEGHTHASDVSCAHTVCV